MIELTDQMREAVNSALAEGVPVVVATASKDGRPDMAFKGSVMVFDGEHLAFWERSFGETLANVRQNPHVCVLYRSRERGVVWRFYGEAEIHADDALRRQVMERVVQPELDRDPERKGMAVLVRVDRVVQGREVIMQREA